MKCKLVDVFAKQRLSGNGLTIFYDYESLDARQMLALTQEMRQFESIFISERITDSSVRARIFTVDEELDFAGHPVVGLAAHLHDEYGNNNHHDWDIVLNRKTVHVKTEVTDKYFKASMDQGKPEFVGVLNVDQTEKVRVALNLDTMNLTDYPLEVISTGLPYLIVPVSSGLENAKISVSDFESLLESFGAKFVYIFDINNFEGRTWDNDGSVEDIATGSAAGPTAAYLYKHRVCSTENPITISQGRLLGRPSEIVASAETEDDVITNIWVSGTVIKVADISFV